MNQHVRKSRQGSDCRDTGIFKKAGILVTEDDTCTRELILDILDLEGYSDVLQAADGVECLSKLKEHEDRIRAVVLDLAMPRLSGADVLESLAELARPHLAILMISGHKEKLSALQSQYGGLGDHFCLDSIAKPFEPPLLVERLEELLGKARRRTQELKGDMHHKLREHVSLIDRQMKSLQASMADLQSMVAELSRNKT